MKRPPSNRTGSLLRFSSPAGPRRRALGQKEPKTAPSLSLPNPKNLPSWFWHSSLIKMPLCITPPPLYHADHNVWGHAVVDWQEPKTLIQKLLCRREFTKQKRKKKKTKKGWTDVVILGQGWFSLNVLIFFFVDGNIIVIIFIIDIILLM